jgi:thioredoxin-related protein
MKNLFIAIMILVSASAFAQTNPLSTAEQKAKKEGKNILITFSGSDWCIPCIRLEKEVFTAETFKKYADSNLVVLNADFPRLKKHKLAKEQQAGNEYLADQYNKQGSFPFTVLLDADGKVLKTWDGSTVGDAGKFVTQLESIHDKKSSGNYSAAGVKVDGKSL